MDISRNITFAKKGLEAGEYEYAVAICKRIITHLPNCIEARKIMYAGLKELDKSKHPFKRICSFLTSNICLLCALFLKGNWRTQFIERALIFYFKNKIGLMWLGERALKLKNLDELIFVYEELSAINPKKTEYTLALASTHFHLGNYKKVLEVTTQILEQDNNNVEAVEWMEKTLLAQVAMDSTFNFN